MRDHVDEIQSPIWKKRQENINSAKGNAGGGFGIKLTAAFEDKVVENK